MTPAITSPASPRSPPSRSKSSNTSTGTPSRRTTGNRPMTDGIEGVVAGLGRAVEILGLVEGDLAAIEGGLASLGWEPPPGINVADLLTLDVTDVITALQALADSTPAQRSDAATMA